MLKTKRLSASELLTVPESRRKQPVSIDAHALLHMTESMLKEHGKTSCASESKRTKIYKKPSSTMLTCKSTCARRYRFTSYGPYEFCVVENGIIKWNNVN